jgi:hypothetical protein
VSLLRRAYDFGRRLLSNEPAVIIGTTASVLALGGIQVSDADTEAWTNLLAAIPLIAGLFTRQKVTPAAHVEAALLIQTDNGPRPEDGPQPGYDS